jgi:hypothetical protein
MKIQHYFDLEFPSECRKKNSNFKYTFDNDDSLSNSITRAVSYPEWLLTKHEIHIFYRCRQEKGQRNLITFTIDCLRCPDPVSGACPKTWLLAVPTLFRRQAQVWCHPEVPSSRTSLPQGWLMSITENCLHHRNIYIDKIDASVELMRWARYITCHERYSLR